MPVIWGIHNDQSSLDLVGEGFVSIGWEELGNLQPIAADREALKLRIADAYPTAKPGAIPVWAGVLARFINEIHVGDYIVSPNKADRTLNFGTVDSAFYFASGVEVHPNRRVSIQVPSRAESEGPPLSARLLVEPWCARTVAARTARSGSRCDRVVASRQ